MSVKTQLEVVECYDLPANPDTNKVYRLLPKNVPSGFTQERTDRNIGWITPEEQQQIRGTTVDEGQQYIRGVTLGIAGSGGMGGTIGGIMQRLGVKEIRLADCEDFDVSNINRQLAAGHQTVGVSKAFATARVLRAISEDSTIVVYPQGITPETAASFLDGCDVVFDEIEFWELYPRIVLHQNARRLNVPLFVCDTVGFGSRLFLYTPTSMHIEKAFGVTEEEALEIYNHMRAGTMTQERRDKAKAAAMRAFVPEPPAYRTDGGDLDLLNSRLKKEGKASIIATNPPLASGFVCDRVLLYLLDKFGLCERNHVRIPEMPGYLYLDVARMDAHVHKGIWWNEEA